MYPHAVQKLAENEDLLALIERIASADREALTQLIDATAPTLLALLRRMVTESVPAGVLLEECFTEVWEMAPLYDRYAGEPWTWILTVARARGMSYRDKRRGKGKAPPVESHGGFGTNQAAQALLRLPEGQRAVLVEVFLDGLPGGASGSSTRAQFAGSLTAFAASLKHGPSPDESEITLGGEA